RRNSISGGSPAPWAIPCRSCPFGSRATCLSRSILNRRTWKPAGADGLSEAPASMTLEHFPVPDEQAGATLAAFPRLRQPGQSWAQVRRLVASRRVRIDGDLCLDPSRRLREG